MFYRAEGEAVCADVIPFYDQGEFKLFYLRDYRDLENHGEGCPWCLLTGQNLGELTDHGPVLLRGTKQEQDLYVFTGCCIRAEGKYMIFYTGHNPHLRAQGLPEQKILRATSTDLIHWEKDRSFVFEAPQWLEPHDFRDPFVYYDEDAGKYAMLLAARVKSDLSIHSGGVTMIAYSDDLEHWELERTPFYAPEAYFTHECPDLFQMGNWWYLIFSEFTDKEVTKYRMARSPRGPWITPAVDTFDGHAFYAAKSVSDGNRRILFGWNCIKNEEKDDAPWQWGGTVISHELVQNPDGTLSVKCPEEIRDFYRWQVPVQEGYRQGVICKMEDGYTVGRNDGMSIQMLGHMPQNCKISMSFVSADEIGDFGLLLRESQDHNRFYKVKFERLFNRLTFDKLPRKDNKVHCQVDVERYCRLETGKQNTLTVIAEGSVLEVYVNDTVAMSCRMFDLKDGDWGLYAHNTTVAFQNISVCTEEAQ